MSCEFFETNSYCVGGRHHSSTISIESVITKTGQKFFIGKCVQCNGKKSMIVSDNTKAAEGLGSFFEKLGRSSKAGKKLTTNVMKHPRRALEIGAKISTAVLKIQRKPYQLYQML